MMSGVHDVGRLLTLAGAATTALTEASVDPASRRTIPQYPRPDRADHRRHQGRHHRRHHRRGAKGRGGGAAANHFRHRPDHRQRLWRQPAGCVELQSGAGPRGVVLKARLRRDDRIDARPHSGGGKAKLGGKSPGSATALSAACSGLGRWLGALAQITARSHMPAEVDRLCNEDRLCNMLQRKPVKRVAIARAGRMARTAGPLTRRPDGKVQK